MRRERRRCAVSCILVALCLAQTQARDSRRLSQVRAFRCGPDQEPRDSALREDQNLIHWVVQSFLDLWYSQDPCPSLHLGVLRLDRTISDGGQYQDKLVAAVSEAPVGRPVA